MRVKIISADPELSQQCHEILVRLQGEDLNISSNHEDPGTFDICIWDYSTSIKLPEVFDLGHCRNHLFLVESRQASAMLRKLPPGPIGLLLKPVTTATLTTFLDQAVTRCKDDGGKIADRDEILQYLLQANLKLQEYDHHRTNFLARAIHDFRAPLTALNGYCGLLLEGMLGPLGPQQKEVIESMAQSATRLARMSSSLFALSVGREARRPIHVREHPIESCVQQAVYELAGMSREKDISVSVDLLPAPCSLFFEPTQVEQLLINLLENACKFTPKHGTIEISGYPDFWDGSSSLEQQEQTGEPNVYRIDIKDSGSGIPSEYLPTIFEEYTSYSGPDDRSGGGLGLAICKTIAEAHRGSIWVRSEVDHVTFSFVFPLRISGSGGGGTTRTGSEQLEVLTH